MTPQQQQIVFISYSHVDTDFVNQFAAVLDSCGLQVWRDTKDIPIGGNIPKRVFEAIKSASHFCCIISATSIESAWVEDELSYAKMRQNEDRSLQIVPVLIDDVEIPPYLKAYRCAQLQNRALSLTNPQVRMILEAFGVKAPPNVKHIVTGDARKKLLATSTLLRQKLFEFRDRAAAWSRLRQTISQPDESIYYPDWDSSIGGRSTFDTGGGSVFSDSRASAQWESMEREAHRQAAREYRESQRQDSRKTGQYHWDYMRKMAPHILKAVELVRQAGIEADIATFKETDWLASFYVNDFHLWKDLNALLEDVANKAEIVIDNEDFDFDRGLEFEYHVERWIPELMKAETSLENIMGILASWADFDQAGV